MMNIKPIHSEADYIESLTRIEALMDAKPGAPEGDELEILATLVEAYEEKHYPIESPDPFIVTTCGRKATKPPENL